MNTLEKAADAIWQECQSAKMGLNVKPTKGESFALAHVALDAVAPEIRKYIEDYVQALMEENTQRISNLCVFGTSHPELKEEEKP